MNQITCNSCGAQLSVNFLDRRAVVISCSSHSGGEFIQPQDGNRRPPVRISRHPVPIPSKKEFTYASIEQLFVSSVTDHGKKGVEHTFCTLNLIDINQESFKLSTSVVGLEEAPYIAQENELAFGMPDGAVSQEPEI